MPCTLHSTHYALHTHPTNTVIKRYIRTTVEVMEEIAHIYHIYINFLDEVRKKKEKPTTIEKSPLFSYNELR
jgi:hypothetical protein